MIITYHIAQQYQECITHQAASGLPNPEPSFDTSFKSFFTVSFLVLPVPWWSILFYSSWISWLCSLFVFILRCMPKILTSFFFTKYWTYRSFLWLFFYHNSIQSEFENQKHLLGNFFFYIKLTICHLHSRWNMLCLKGHPYD